MPLVQNLQAADDVVDFLNNEIGRNIAAGLGENATSLDIARETLRVQRDEGFWTVQTAKAVVNEYYKNGLWTAQEIKDKDGNVVGQSIQKTKLTESQYKSAMTEIDKKGQDGLNKK